MTIALKATDYSRLVRPLFIQKPRRGIIHSLFQRAMNIALDDTIIAVLSDVLPCMPNGVRLPSTQLERILRSGSPGMEVLAGDGKLFIPSSNISLCLQETSLWEPRPEVEGCQWCQATVAQHVRLLAHYLTAHQQNGLAPLAGPLLLGQSRGMTPLGQIALPRLQLLAGASWRRDSTGVEVAACGLAGLGPGLTPAGDDTLAGFASVMALLSSRLSADTYSREHIAEIIAAVARPKTTRLSAVLLTHAAHGEVAEHLGNLFLALSLPTEGSETVLHVARHLLAFGATSGGDTLLGILLGLRTLEGMLNDDLYGA